MSEEQKPKLNLKALSSGNIDKDVREDTTDSKQETSSLGTKVEKKEISQEDTSGEVKEAIEESGEKKSFKISFSDIKKPSPSEDIPVKTNTSNSEQEEKTDLSEINNSELNLDKKTTGVEAVENKSIEKKDTASPQAITEEGKALTGDTSEETDESKNTLSLASEDIEEKAEENKDKLAMENAAKAKGIMQEKELTKKEKRKSIFSIFSKTKKKTKGKEDATKQEGILQNERQEAETIETVKEKIHFENYESHFKHESSNFLKKFQRFKYTPKTRVGLIVGLISITCVIIGSLMVLMPEKHSPQIYKASIFNILGKAPEEIPQPLDKQGLVEENQTSDPIVEIQEEIIQTTQEKKEESKEKLREHLLNKYSS